MTQKLNHCNLFQNPGACGRLILNPSPSAVLSYSCTALLGMLQYGATRADSKIQPAFVHWF